MSVNGSHIAEMRALSRLNGLMTRQVIAYDCPRWAATRNEGNREMWSVTRCRKQWKAFDGDLVAGPFETNSEAWRWIDRNTNEGGDEGDHAGRQDWSIKQYLQAE